jgi:filamentous hemagglutinin
MFNSNRWLFVAVLLVLGAAGSWVYESDRTPQPAFNSSTNSSSEVWSPGHDGSGENVEEHWAKHGSEFPKDHDAQEYDQDALHFVRNPPPGTLIKHRANGDTLYYNPGSNIFAVTDSAGKPKTMFKPDRGEAYWDHQH